MYDLKNHKYLTMYIIGITNFVSNLQRSCTTPMVKMSAWELQTYCISNYLLMYVPA